MILRLGMAGHEIGKLHQQLVENGYSLDSSELTKQLFGNVTKSALEDFQHRHVAQDGDRLIADGIVGPRTAWALEHPAGPEDRYVVAGWKCEPSAVRSEATGAIQAAIADIGRLESPNGSNKGPMIEKYFRDGEAGLPWCAFSACTWLKEASGLRADFRRTGSCSRLREWALGHNAVVAPEDAQPGDLWLTIRAGGHGHVGLIVHRFSADQVALVEGNSGNSVRGTVRTPQSATIIARPIPIA